MIPIKDKYIFSLIIIQENIKITCFKKIRP